VVDKGHGRIETRRVWSCLVDPPTLGLAGAAQRLRLERDVQFVRRGKVVKETHDVVLPFTNLWPEELSLHELQPLARDHWSIENGQHHRRDRTKTRTVVRCAKPTPLATSRGSAPRPYPCAKLIPQSGTASSPSGMLSAGLVAVPGA
jgi:hypothetical protein